MEPDGEIIEQLWDDVQKHKEATVRAPDLDNPNDSQYEYSATGNRLMRDRGKQTTDPKGNAPADRNSQLRRNRKHPSSPSPASGSQGSPRSKHCHHSDRGHISRHKHRSRHTSSHKHHSAKHKHLHSRRHSRSQTHSPTPSSSTPSRSGSSSRTLSPEPAKWLDKLASAQTDSSWTFKTGKRGTRPKAVDANNKQVIQRTPIEDLKTREEKYKHVRANGHWFGRLFHFRFNPYTSDNSLAKDPKHKLFSRPFAQPGRKQNSLQNAIGLTDDRDFYNDILETLRKYCTKYGPDKSADHGQNWRSVPTHNKAMINMKMLQVYPFLAHFCDKDGDSWAVKMMAQTYLGGSKAYNKRKLSNSVGGRQLSPPRNPAPPREDHPAPVDAGEGSATAGGQNEQQTASERRDRGSHDQDANPNSLNAASGDVGSKKAADRRKAAKVVERELERAGRLEAATQAKKKADAEAAAKKRGKRTDKNKKGTHRDPLEESPAESSNPQKPSTSGRKNAKPVDPTDRTTRSYKARPVPVKHIPNDSE